MDIGWLLISWISHFLRMNSDSPHEKSKKIDGSNCHINPPQKKNMPRGPPSPIPIEEEEEVSTGRTTGTSGCEVPWISKSKPVFQAMFLYGLGDLLLAGELLVVAMIQDWRRVLRCFHWKWCTNAFHIYLDMLVNLGYWRVSTIRIRPEQFDPQTPGRLAYWMEYIQERYLAPLTAFWIP